MLWRICLGMGDQVDDLFQSPDPPDVIRRGRGASAARAPRIRHVGIERHDLLDFDPVSPVVAEVVDVRENGPLGAQDLAKISLFLVGEGSRQVTSAVRAVRLTPLASAFVLEAMQVKALPAERLLDDGVQEPEARRRRNLDPPPQWRTCSLKADLQLMDSRGMCTWHSAKLPIRAGPQGLNPHPASNR